MNLSKRNAAVLAALNLGLAGCGAEAADNRDEDTAEQQLGASGALNGSRVQGGWGTKDLAGEGTTDWAHWGLGGSLTAFNHKSGVTQQISTFTRVGGGTLRSLNCCASSFSWTGGTPTASASGVIGGVYVDTPNPSGDGFQITIPADTTTKTLKLYTGAWCARTKLTATLSDGSAAAYSDSSFDVGSGANTSVYTVQFHAGSNGQTLTVKYTVDANHCTTGDYGEAWLLGATLETLAAPTWTSSIADGQTVQTGATWSATVNPTPDSVEFWATPVGGASTKLKTDTSAPYDVVLNLTAGSYILGLCAWHGSVRTCFDDRKTVTVTSASPPPPPPTSSAYFVADYQNGTFGSPWTTLFSQASPGFVDLKQTGPRVGTSDGRTKVVPSPSGPGNAARFEIRDADPGWPIDTTLDKSEASSNTQETFNKSAVSVGDVRWFSMQIYLPYTASEKFEWAHGGSNDFTALIGLHPGGNYWSALGVRWYPETPQWATMVAYGGEPKSFQYAETIKLWQLTDASGNRVMSNHNRWISLLWGMRFAPDTTGWLEVWVDGVNIYPRKSRPTMWTGDTSQYFKYGVYKQGDASFPETGRSVIYFGRTTIGLTKP